jgi:ABC-type nitrate/sulfonate/bicarbonate transport system permease component
MKQRQFAIFIGLSLVLIWELVFYLAVVDFSRFSHPFGIVTALRNADFISALGSMLVYVLIASFSGVVVGLPFAALVSKNPSFAQTTIHFFRILVWVPFFVFWAIPYTLLPTAIFAVSLFACSRFLSIRLNVSSPWRNAILQVQRQAIFHSLLFYLLFEIWSVEGWMLLGIDKIDNVYASLLVLVLFVFFVDRFFRSNFPTDAETQVRILVKEIACPGKVSFRTAGLLIVVCLIGWEIFSLLVLQRLSVGSFLAVLEAVYSPLVSGWLFGDIAVSLLEISAGMIVGGGSAVFIFRSMLKRVSGTNIGFQLFPITFIVAIMTSLIEIHWVGWDVSSLGTVLGVALITVCPFVRVLGTFRDHPLFFRVLLAAEDALPYAFLAMLFGESMSSSKGLGFVINVARNTSYLDRSLGVSLLTFALLILISFILRTVTSRSIHRQAVSTQMAAETG